MELTKHSPSDEPPPSPPQTGLIHAAAECLRAIVHEVSLQQQALQAAITTRVAQGYTAGSTRVYSFLDTSRFYLQRVVIFYVLLTVVLAVVVADLSGCLVTSVATAAGIRHLVLANVPGSAVIPLHFNALPFHTEDWQRHVPDDATLHDFFLPDRETRALLQSMPHRSDALSVLQQHMGQFVDAKFSLLSYFVQSHLASTTLHIPRTAASAELFSPKGGVNLEGLFQLGPAMFNAKGEYTALLQVVLAKEEVGRDVPLVLESAMLFSEDAVAAQPVGHLDVLFKKSTSTTVRTGPAHQAWLVALVHRLLRLCFYAPVRSYEYLLSTLRQKDNAPFPPIDTTREVASVLEVYRRFTPPLALQPRLRAMNFTLYQLPDAGAASRVKVSRLVFLSTVQLTGAARWLTDYPVSTFLLLIGLFFGAFATVTLGGLAAVIVYVYWRWFQTSAAEAETVADEEDGDDDDEDFFVPTRTMPLTVARNTSAPSLHRRRSANDFYNSLDTSQLRRSQSFNYSPGKKQQ
ncbi:hypothetical protein NESM_000733600 [Novymonas esmeraldas]|uniref:Seipin n=1 Tax=Novymonas esmeraldas TaxID=1808958 RepID=A0AAW0EVI6_9TRYP